MAEKTPTSEPRMRPLGWSIAASVALLLIFWFLQAIKFTGMDMKAQWIWAAAFPILIGLIVGRYILTFEGAGIKLGLAGAQQLPEIRPQLSLEVQATSIPGAASPQATFDKQTIPAEVIPWQEQRTAEYERTGRLFLVHVYEPSSKRDQKYDVAIFLLRHVPGEEPNQRENFTEIDKLEVFLGRAWRNQVFTATNNGGRIGIRTSAWGSFLAQARVIFKDQRAPVFLQRYVDFEMAPKKA